jgi:hypothetical protein
MRQLERHRIRLGTGNKMLPFLKDFRNCGDFAGTSISLQVLCGIESSGGRLLHEIDEIFLSQTKEPPNTKA